MPDPCGIDVIPDDITTGVDALCSRRRRGRVRDSRVRVDGGRVRRRIGEQRVSRREGGSLNVLRATAGKQGGGDYHPAEH